MAVEIVRQIWRMEGIKTLEESAIIAILKEI